MSDNHKRKRKKATNQQINRNKTIERKDANNPFLCTLCKKSIRDLRTAVAHHESGQPVHFDCIIHKLEKEEILKTDEKIYYLGGGSFGIIQQRAGNSPIRFFIRKRIQYENKDASYEWRKDTCNREITNLVRKDFFASKTLRRV